MEGQEPVVFERIELVMPTTAELAAYAGRFYSDELQATYPLEVVDGRLTLRRRGAEPQPLRPTTRDEFAAGR